MRKDTAVTNLFIVKAKLWAFIGEAIDDGGYLDNLSVDDLVAMAKELDEITEILKGVKDDAESDGAE